jgi:hypothetical protein
MQRPVSHWPIVNIAAPLDVSNNALQKVAKKI